MPIPGPWRHQAWPRLRARRLAKLEALTMSCIPLSANICRLDGNGSTMDPESLAFAAVAKPVLLSFVDGRGGTMTRSTVLLVEINAGATVLQTLRQAGRVKCTV